MSKNKSKQIFNSILAKTKAVPLSTEGLTQVGNEGTEQSTSTTSNIHTNERSEQSTSTGSINRVKYSIKPADRVRANVEGTEQDAYARLTNSNSNEQSEQDALLYTTSTGTREEEYDLSSSARPPRDAEREWERIVEKARKDDLMRSEATIAE